MQKLLLTTYRKLLHMCSTVDASVSLRSCLVCVPAVVYDHHAYEWTRIDVREVMTLSESELYLDALVRRLNNNRQYYVPPTAEELTDVTTTTTAISSSSSSSTSAKSDIEAGSSSSSSSSVGGVRARSGDKRASAQTSASPPPPLPTVPLSLRAYTPLRRALRVLYEQTPYSIGRVNDAFAAVKLLSYVCARTPCDDEHAKQQSHEVQQKDRQQQLAPLTPPEALRALSTPPLTRLLLPLSVYSPAMAHGVTAELRRALRVRSGAAATTSTAAKAGASDDASKPPASEATSAASAAAAVTDDASTSAHDVQEEEEAEGGSAAAANTTSSSTTTTSVASPEHVQLLLAHPMLDGFFANTVQLLVRNTPHEAAALTLNKPLVNEKGVFMRVCDTIRYTRVHPIFQQHLSQHVLMIGGPVMVSGTFDESIFLLHRVAGVAEATPVAEGLWLDGNLDALAAQLSAGVADASRDVVVLCGFAGWAREQLAGEVRGGTWVVAHTPAAHTHVADMLMALTRTAAHGAKALRSSEAAVAAAVKATMQTQEVHEKQQQQEQQQQQQQQREDDDDEDDAVMSRERAVRRVVRTWAWVYELLGAPYTALGHNQRIERGD